MIPECTIERQEHAKLLTFFFFFSLSDDREDTLAQNVLDI